MYGHSNTSLPPPPPPLNPVAPKAPNSFWSIESGQFFPPNTWQIMTFLNPLDVLIPKIPFSLFFFAEFSVLVTSRPGLSLDRIFGGREWSPSFGGV